MRKLTSTIIFLIVSTICFSQNFIQRGSIWYYSADLVNNTSGYQNLCYESDTIIDKYSYNKIVCQMIIRDRKNEEYKKYSLDNLYIRQSNDTIYCLNKDGKDRFAWNQNPKPGDIWYFGEVCDPNTHITKKIYTRVDSVVKKYYDGIESKTIYSTPNVDSKGNDLGEVFFYSPLYIKKINTLFGPYEHFGDISQLETTEYINGNFSDKILCYGSKYNKFLSLSNKNCFNNIDK